MKNNNQMNEVKETKAVEKTSRMRFVTPDGLIFYSREDYLDYVRGL